MSEFRSADVYVQGIHAGVLEETETGYRFSYSGDYLTQDDPLPISLTMPVCEESYESPVLFAFFDGLIPEGWLLDVVERHWKIDHSDRFGLLLAACRDCIGDVSIVRRENTTEADS